MSRSRRKTPLMGITSAKSEKDDKRIANRRWRRAVRIAIHKDNDPIPHRRSFGNPWWFAKDGRQWIDPESRWMRK